MSIKKGCSSGSLIIRFSDDMKQDLKAVAGITGRTVSQIIRDAVGRELAQFDNGSGRVAAVPAKRISGLSEYEKGVAAAEGRRPEIGYHDCYVLEETMMYRQAYYKIYDCEGGNIMKVPKDHVAIGND